ncbi:MAG TPA: hypothetical protein VKJ00_13335, partial [Thermoanaerobaculia bacterium]|nr:hypothetical protein [Thermoanaerobaculia bacterium]
RGLEDRGRLVIRVGSAPDIDGLASLASFERGLGPCATRALVREILNAATTRARPAREVPRFLILSNPTSPRAPPKAA